MFRGVWLGPVARYYCDGVSIYWSLVSCNGVLLGCFVESFSRISAGTSAILTHGLNDSPPPFTPPSKCGDSVPVMPLQLPFKSFLIHQSSHQSTL
jgi:hypothetical protein